MILRNINTIDVKFAFLATNRNIFDNKGLKESIKEKGVLVPIIVTKGNNVGAKRLYDVNDYAEIAQENKGDYYVVLDGQHRLITLIKVLREKKEVSDEDKMIPAIIKTKEEVGDDVDTFIIDMNSTSKNWRNSDYIKNASQAKPNDELIQAIQAFGRNKFPISTISRYICLNNYGITSKTLTDYVYNGKEISYADYKRAIRLYLFLKGKGLSENFLRKRYMIDYIAEMKKQNDSINPVLNLINYLQSDATEKINALKVSECDVKSEIDRILNENFDRVLKEADNDEDRQRKESHRDREYLAMVSDEDIRKFIEQPVEKPKKNNSSSKAEAKKQNEKQETVQTEFKESEQEKPQESVQSESQGKVQTQTKDEASSKPREVVVAEPVPEENKQEEQQEDDSDNPKLS